MQKQTLSKKTSKDPQLPKREGIIEAKYIVMETYIIMTEFVFLGKQFKAMSIDQVPYLACA